MKNIDFYLLLFIFILSPSIYLLGQELSNQNLLFPPEISVEYGIGNYSVKDEYISKEKYSGSLPFYRINWINPQQNYIYHFSLDYSYSSEIKNYNVSTDIYQFTLNQGYSYTLPSFSLFNKNVHPYLGPSIELFFYYNRQNIAVQGFDYSQSFALLMSAGINLQLYYNLMDDLDIESSLNFSVLSLGIRMVDFEETDESPLKLLTLSSGTNAIFKIGPRYYLMDNLSVKAAYLFHFTRISSWEPLISASDNVVLTLAYVL